MAEQHSLFGPSSLSRRQKCPGSWALELEKGVNYSSSFAKEGTACHEMINEYFQNGTSVDKWTEFDGIDVTAELKEAMRKCIMYIEAFDPPFDETFHEIRVALNDDVWGTADFIGVHGTDIWVIDYKMGRGVKVKAEGNLQLQVYGVGAVQLLRMLGYERLNDRTIHLCILQPRLEGNWISKVSMTVEDLVLKTASPVVDIVATCKSEEGRNTYVSGSQCQFCSAKAFCPLHAEKALALARSEFKLDLSYDELLEIQDSASDIIAYLKAVEATLIDAVESKKLGDRPYAVEQRYGNETWIDEEKAKEELYKLRKKVPDITFHAKAVPFMSPAQVRKVLKANKLEFDVAALTKRNPSSKVLQKITTEEGELV